MSYFKKYSKHSKHLHYLHGMMIGQILSKNYAWDRHTLNY